jgi:hypothetical protein
MAEALMEEVPFTVGDTPVSKGPAPKGADILTAALAAVAASHPLAWIVDTRTADE